MEVVGRQRHLRPDDGRARVPSGGSEDGDDPLLSYDFPMPLHNTGANALRVIRRALAGRIAPLLVTLGRP
jgi:hypothetical protein